MKKILGYIVTDSDGTPLWMEHRTRTAAGTYGVLFIGPEVTVFASRAKARAAISVTRQWVGENALDWNDVYNIKRLRASESTT